MKKYVYLIVIAMLLFTSCTQPDKSQPLSSSEALSIVEESVKASEDELFCEYNGKQMIADSEYHRIRVYTKSTEWLYDIDGTPYKQGFTYAWLYVDIHTGEIYQEEGGKIDVLVPWP